MSLAQRMKYRKLRKHKDAEQCIECGHIVINDTIWPFLMCTEGHPPSAMRKLNPQ